MTEDNAYFEDIIYVDYESSDAEDSALLNALEKENTKKVTSLQADKLMSTMGDGIQSIPKGKVKSDECTKKLLAEWEALTLVLNNLGPPCHASSKWRRIFTKMKSNKKRRSARCQQPKRSTSVHTHPFSTTSNERFKLIEPQDKNKSIDPGTDFSLKSAASNSNVKPMESNKSIDPGTDFSLKSAESNSNVKPMESDIVDNATNKVTELKLVDTENLAKVFESIAREFSQLREFKTETGRKLDALVVQQEKIDRKLDVIAKALGIDVVNI